jgi:macrolide-specific efflux system membrane fusion protein
MRRFWIIALVVVAGAGSAYWARSDAEARQLAAVPATVAVSRGAVEQTVLAAGVIEAGTLVSVGARVSGLIETLAVDVGDVVREGDLIAQIESLDQQNEVLQAEADLAQIAAQIAAQAASLREADLGLARKRTLNTRNLTSTADLEAAEAALAVARANLGALAAQRDRAKVAVASARLALERTRITAPISGTVVAVVTSQGQSVNATNSSPTIVKIADLTRMVVKAEVSEADVTRVAPGQTATLSLLGEPDAAIAATLRAVEPAPASIKDSDEVATDEAIYYNALFDVANPDGKLRIGMTAQVTIRLAQAEGVPVVLSSTLGPKLEDGTYAVEVWDPVARRRDMRTVTIGVTDNITAEIRSGLAEGDLVVADRVSGQSSAARLPRMPGLF